MLAVGYAFGSDVDHARIVKIYGKDREGHDICTGVRKERVTGNPDMSRACTSFVERSNLTLRMSNKRFARKTIAHSKKIENHRYMLAIGFMHYNYCRKHQSLRMTPAQRAGIADHQWSLEEVVEMMEAREQSSMEDAFMQAFAEREEARLAA